jgi:hypothetical protein
LQEQEEVEARKIYGRLSGNYDFSIQQNIQGIFFQGHGMYGRPRNPGSRSSATSKSSYQNSSATGLHGKYGVDRFGNARLCNNGQSRTISSEAVKTLKHSAKRSTAAHKES